MFFIRFDNDRNLAGLGEFDRIGEEIEQNLFYPGAVTDDERRDTGVQGIRHLDLLLCRSPRKNLQRLDDDLGKIEGGILDFDASRLDL